MTTFLLIHGAWHGAWCWDSLVHELGARGHRAVAVDLPAEDRSAGLAAYVDTACAPFADGSAPDDLVVVGHSLGGLTAPVAAQRLGAARVVYVCAFIPEPGNTFREQAARSPEPVFSPTWADLSRGQTTTADGATVWDPVVAVDAFYHDLDPDVAGAAADRLRPQHWTITKDVCPLTALPTIPSVSVLCRDDRVISPTWSRAVTRTILGAEAVELDGSHSPMLSRPLELAEVLTS